jgi:DNA polymerase-3 subunit gamma/tau
MGQFRNLLINILAPQNRLLDMNESEKEEARRQAELAGSEKLQILLNFLINREQDLRFTSNPRLILETTMIKLCHLGDYLSIGDLLEKISSLEKRVVAASATIEQPKADHVSDPDAQWVSENREIEQAEPKSKPESGQSWDDFLNFLSSKNRFMFGVLKDWQFLNLTEKTLEIARGEQAFSSGFFDDKERLDQLSSYCRDFFQRDILIKIAANSRPQSQKKLASTAEHPEPEAAKNSDLPPPVQDILHMFQGEIQKGNPSKQNGPRSPKGMKK